MKRVAICMVGLIMIGIVVFAQESAEKPARFVFSPEAFGKLQKENLPEDMLKKLNDLKDQAYVAESDVLAALEQTIGKDMAMQYQFPILNATYRYPLEGRREPFEPLVGDVEKDPAPVVTPLPGAPCEGPLGNVEVRQLKVVGIVLGQPGDRARVIAPDGKSYTIMSGTCIGKFNGKVTALADNCLVVKEIKEFQNGNETPAEEVETVLCINPVEQEKK